MLIEISHPKRKWRFWTITTDLSRFGFGLSNFTLDRIDIHGLELSGTTAEVGAFFDNLKGNANFADAGWDPFHRGPDYRENVATNSMQITGNRSGGIHIDIDPNNPRDVVGGIKHLRDVIGNGRTGDTNYSKVAQELGFSHCP